MSEKKFRFSPRINRASDINWHDWSEEVFRIAEQENKPVLLSISAVWCHWCHVMDETTYSDPEIIKLINENFVAVRIDNDRRPDINERYNMGGWPTTAILTAEGELVTGGTYIPPDRMKDFVKQILRLFREEPEKIKKLGDKIRTTALPVEGEHKSLDQGIYYNVMKLVKQAFDPVYGGFGREPKFPMIGALELSIQEYARTNDPKIKKIFVLTFENMAVGGTYDQIEGGFFRYSTNRDWSVPHFEKMLEDNALLFRVFTMAYQVTGNRDYQEVVEHVFNYLYQNLYIPEEKSWAGSQDADEEYYNLPLKKRKLRKPPFIDRTVYVNWNALLVRSLLLGSKVFERPAWEELALDTMKVLLEKGFQEEFGMAHFLQPEPGLWGYLDDQVAVGTALVDIYQATGEEYWLRLSGELANFCLEKLQIEGGGFNDVVAGTNERGALTRPNVNMDLNARAARWLTGLSHLTGSPELKEAAEKALLRWQASYPEYGVLAAGYALAVADVTRDWSSVTVVGKKNKPGTRDLLQSALAGFSPHKTVQLFDPLENPEEAEKKGYQGNGQALAYVCLGGSCFPPFTDGRQLKSFLQEEAIK